MVGAKGSDILYVGDHIFGDILRSKKSDAWRTFLVVPELKQELQCLERGRRHTKHLKNLEFLLAEVYRGLASDCKEAPDTDAVRAQASPQRATLTWSADLPVSS